MWQHVHYKHSIDQYIRQRLLSKKLSKTKRNMWHTLACKALSYMNYDHLSQDLFLSSSGMKKRWNSVVFLKGFFTGVDSMCLGFLLGKYIFNKPMNKMICYVKTVKRMCSHIINIILFDALQTRWASSWLLSLSPTPLFPLLAPVSSRPDSVTDGVFLRTKSL